MRLAILFTCLIFFIEVQSQNRMHEKSLGLVINMEKSEYEPGLNADRQYWTIGLEYAGRYQQIGIRGGFTLSKKFERRWYNEDSPFIDLIPTIGDIKRRLLEIPLSVQYYPRLQKSGFLQPYFSGGVHAACGQDMLTGHSFKELFDDTEFHQVTGLGFLLYPGASCSIDLQGFFKIQIRDAKTFSNRGNIYGLQSKLNYIF